ncbi:MAG: response regulator transcription factor [Edaphobacter sp.]|uniref:response regulator n=1 Tax=Edaphobacter sp. TaxID=1934404 RepID=UPI00239A36D0|nr:response regulator transcription factor [Edaphobacter sp.]MDE1176982.1 response regulator transcription factor [Edaphobacter sp.]
MTGSAGAFRDGWFVVSQGKQIRVLIADDHPMIRDGLAMAIHSQPDMVLVGAATGGHEAVALFQLHRPDVMLMDLVMPDLGGIDAIDRIRQDFPQARIIVLTTYSGDIQAARALKAGASGYLLKSMLSTELVDTIRRVHMGQRRIQPEIASEIASHIDADRLSEREVDVLTQVATGSSNKQIGVKLHISEDTVKGHMKNILAKLKANDRTHAVLIGMKRGYLKPE